MNFKTLKSNPLNGGIQYLFKADNGYGASIVKHDYSYGGNNGLYELAVIKYESDEEWHLCYDTPITSDVLGHLTEEEVNSTLEEIAKLPNQLTQ